MRPSLRAAVAVASALAFVSAAACTSHPSPGPAAARCPKPNGITSVGESIPAECSLERFGGGVLRLDDLLGKPAVINFWATWCVYCVDEMPGLQRAYSSFSGRVNFVGADLLGVEGETRHAATSFARRTGVHYTLVYDTDAILYGHFSAARPILPVTIFVRSDGRVAFRQFGPLTERQVRRLLRDKLGIG